jgi:hypothetical protein
MDSRESRKINTANGRELIEIGNEEVEIGTETTKQQELQLEQELRQLKWTFSSDGKFNAHGQEVLRALDERET